MSRILLDVAVEILKENEIDFSIDESKHRLLILYVQDDINSCVRQIGIINGTIAKNILTRAIHEIWEIDQDECDETGDPDWDNGEFITDAMRNG